MKSYSENMQGKALESRIRKERRKKKKVIGGKPNIFLVHALLINGGDATGNKT